MSQLNVGTLRPSEAFTVPLQTTAERNATNHAVGAIIYNTNTNAAQVLTSNDGWLNLGKGKVVASGGTVSEPGNGWKYHVFTNTSGTGTFTVTSVGFQAYAEVLVVAGGGGGGGSHSGGGGGGARYPGSSPFPEDKTGGNGGSGIVIVLECVAGSSAKSGIYSMAEQYVHAKRSSW